jgi:phosphohistidine phosphatase
MSLYLVQHGKSLAKEIDPDQGLSDEGIKEINIIADTARMYKVRVNEILHSGKKRARQTAALFSEKLGAPPVSATEGLNPMDDPIIKAAALDPGANLMLVGHLPFMERLASYLTTGSVDYIVFKFQNAGIVCLDKQENSEWWSIKWALMPRIG